MEHTLREYQVVKANRCRKLAKTQAGRSWVLHEWPAAMRYTRHIAHHRPQQDVRGYHNASPSNATSAMRLWRQGSPLVSLHENDCFKHTMQRAVHGASSMQVWRHRKGARNRQGQLQRGEALGHAQ